MAIILIFEDYRKNNRKKPLLAVRPSRSLREVVGSVQTWDSDAEKARILQEQSERDLAEWL